MLRASLSQGGWHASGREPLRGERFFSMLAWTVVACLLALLSLGVVLRHRGRAAMEQSDRAFHDGALRDSVLWAQRSGLAYLPAAHHVRAAEERLEAIARGAETRGDWDLARRAWDALRLIDEQTHYPGRGTVSSGERARQGLARLAKNAERPGWTTEIR